MPLRTPSASGKEGGFTLTELLVCCGLVMLLAVLVAFAAGRVRLVTQQATNVHQLRQIGVATLAYAADHAGVLPGNDGPNTGNTTLGSGFGAGAPARKLFDKAQWSFGTGKHAYLSTPDILYSPFALDYRNRPSGTLAAGPIIGYMFYYMPRYDPKADASGKSRIHPTVFNDRLTENSRAPIYTDRIYAMDLKPEKFSSSFLNVLYLDGSVKAFDYATVVNITSWRPRIDYLMK